MVLSLQGLEGDLRKDDTTKKTTEKKINKTREIILDAIKNNPSLTNKELATICGITTDGVYYQLKQIKTSGLIRRAGPDIGGNLASASAKDNDFNKAKLDKVFYKEFSLGITFDALNLPKDWASWVISILKTTYELPNVELYKGEARTAVNFEG